MKNICMFISIVLLCGLANAETTILNPIGSNDENKINELLKDGGTVTLENRVYEVSGPIYIHSNTVLTGGPDTVIKVSSSSSQWFTGQTGIICNPDEALHNVEIYGFSIDGNIGNLPRSYDSTPGHDRDAEKLILIGGWSSAMGSNIKIHDMKLYNAFSDGVYIRFTEGIKIYNNEIINCQHEGFFISACKNIEIYDNKISGICSDGGRLDNSQYYKVHNNTFVSFDGDSFGAYKGGEAGLQIGDQGNSVNHGFAPSYKPFKTNNVEVYNNIFGYSSERAINLNNYNSDANIYIHDNTYLSKTQLERAGISFDMNYSYDNPPTVEQSEQVFKSIFDILNVKFSTSAFIPQYDQILSLENWQKKGKYTEATLSIDGFKNVSKIDGIEYIPGRAQDNVIVNSQTRNNAPFPAGQKTELKYSVVNDSLTTELIVTTSWYSKSNKHVTILGKRISVPTIKTESETETFNVFVQAPAQFPQTESISAEVTCYNNTYNPHAILSLTNAWGIVQETYQYNGSKSTHYKLIGEVSKKENDISYVNYSKVSTWETTDNQISGYGNDLYISGHFKLDKLNVTVHTPYETIKIENISVVEVQDESGMILNPALWAFVGTFFIFGIYNYRNLKRIIPKF